MQLFFTFSIYYIQSVNKYNQMKSSDMKEILITAAFAGFAYLLIRNYRIKRKKNHESREFIHFQLF